MEVIESAGHWRFRLDWSLAGTVNLTPRVTGAVKSAGQARGQSSPFSR
jgi:hypothetical protein